MLWLKSRSAERWLERRAHFTRTLDWEIGRFHEAKRRDVYASLVSLAESMAASTAKEHEAWVAVHQMLSGDKANGSAAGGTEDGFEDCMPR